MRDIIMWELRVKRGVCVCYLAANGSSEEGKNSRRDGSSSRYHETHTTTKAALQEEAQHIIDFIYAN